MLRDAITSSAEVVHSLKMECKCYLHVGLRKKENRVQTLADFMERALCVLHSHQFTQLSLPPSSADSWLKPIPLINKFSIVMALSQWPPVQTEKNASLEAPQGCFLSLFMQTREMAHPVPTKAFLQSSPEAAMLFAPFGCTHPLPLSCPFCCCRTSSKSADFN